MTFRDSKYTKLLLYLSLCVVLWIRNVKATADTNKHTLTKLDLGFLERFVVHTDNKTNERSVIRESHVVKRSVSARSVPQFMLDMYDYFSDDNVLPTFDTARSFTSIHPSTDFLNTFLKQRRWISGTEVNPGNVLLFNLSHLSLKELIQLAHLRIYVPIPHYDTGSRCYVEIYSLLPEKRQIRVETSVLAEFSDRRLLTADVTPELQKVLNEGDGYLVFEIRSKFPIDVSVEPQLLVLSRVTSKRDESEDTFLKRVRRSLVEASKYESRQKLEQDHFGSTGESFEGATHRRQRKRRSEEEDEELEEQSNYIVEELGRVRKGKVKKKKNPCRRKPLHVNFAAINYDQWIIAPPNYDAFECSGKCSFPMSAHLSPTKHAIIQTLMHSLEPKQISRACCVPTLLSPISVLYVDDDGIVTYKYDYEDMVVAECGCR